METQKFIETVNKLCKKIRKDFSYSNQGDSFVHLCFRMKFNLDDSDVAEYTAIGGKGDKSIDAFWADEDTRTIHIIQGRFSNKGQALIDRKEIAAFGRSIEWLKEVKDKDSLENERLFEASVEFQEKIEKGFGVKLTFFAFGNFSPSAIKEKDAFNKNYQNSSVEMELIDIEQIKALYNAFITAKEQGPKKVELPIRREEYFIKKGPFRSIIATVKTNDIAQIRTSYGTSIYRSNVRYFLGKNRVNENISGTLKDKKQKSNFWYFNNGLSIVCESFQLQEDKIILTNMQIVNGCQTTEVLRDNRGHLDDNVELLVRIVELENPAFSSAITINTNTQNPTTPRDLMSNEDIQEKLQKEFIYFEPPHFYERKRGEFKAYLDTLSPKQQKETKKKFQNTKISNEKVAQAFWAFLGNAASAKSEKGMLFILKDQKGYYDDIFNEERKVEELLFPYRLFEYVSEERKLKNKNLKERKNKAEKITDEQKKEKELEEIARESFINYADFAILAGMGYVCEKRWDDFKSIPYDDLLKKFDEIKGKLYKKIYAELNYLIKAHFKVGSSHNSFFKKRETIKKLKNEIDRAMERSESERKSYFEGISCFE